MASSLTRLIVIGSSAAARPTRCRLYVDGPLAPGVRVQFSDAQQHYLLSVLRCNERDSVLVFDGASGEYAANLELTGRRSCSSTVCGQTREQPPPARKVALLFGLLKPKRVVQLVEKATELGVTHLQPLVTSRTAVRELNLQRARATAIEAAEQCGRLSVPIVLDVERDLVAAISAAAEGGGHVFACAERSSGVPRLDEALRDAQTPGAPPPPVAFVVGPEGGFEEEEFRTLQSAGASCVSLGPNVLRAETAAMAAMATVHCMAPSAHGD